jgi:Patatin-like phospholipase
MRTIAGLALTMTLGSCAIAPTPSMQCGFSILPVEVEQPTSAIPSDAAPRRVSFGDLIGETVTPIAGTDAAARSLLFMSGGGQHGAFGAGMLAGWAALRPSGKLPTFDVVTGVSTGAILSTSAFVNNPVAIAEAYQIKSEAELLTPYAKIKNGKLTTGSYFGLLRKGAVADLGPLRTRLFNFITPDVLQAVASAAPRRQLLVGAVDVDAGKAVAFDLKDMAKRFMAATTDAERIKHRSCYVEAIVASASQPLAARPVFIDNRMYVDGGLRYGVFSNSIGEGIARSAKIRGGDAGNGRDAPPLPAPDIYLIINGTQESHPDCDAGTVGCDDMADPQKPLARPHGKWSFPELALRTTDIMANQIYRFSAADIAAQNASAYPQAKGKNLRFVRIEPNMPMFPHTLSGETKTCGEWRNADANAYAPIQFYPRYMACVVAYGRSRARTSDWR